MLLRYSKSNEVKIIKRAVDVLSKGGLIAYPTDTVYGLGADATKARCIKKIYAAKKRPKNKLVSAIVSDKGMLKKYSEPSELVMRKLPGKYTFILKNKRNLPISGEYAGFRIPRHWCTKISKEFGKPITTTSANISGQATPDNIKDIKKMFGRSVALYIDGGKLSGKPSKIYDKDGKRIR